MTRLDPPSESTEQMSFYRFCRFYEAQIPELRWMFHIPNGGKRSVQAGSRLFYEGVKRGVWDNFLPVPRNGRAGLWLEFKVGRNNLTPEQEAFGGFIEQQGYTRVVCRTWSEAAEATLTYLGLNPKDFGL